MIAGYADSLLNFRGPLIESLQGIGLEVHVVAPGLTRDSEVGMKLEARGVQCHAIRMKRTGMNPVADLFAIIQLFTIARRVRPDYLLAYTIKPVLYGVLTGWLAAVPRRFALITGLGYAFQQGKGGKSLLRSLVQTLYGFALSKADKVIFQNPDDQALFRALNVLPAAVSSCVVNGSGVDVAHFALAPLPAPPGFLLIARLLGDKGVREYVAAARRIRADHPGVPCRIAGWIDEAPGSIAAHELDSWIAEGVIEYLGRLSDVRPALAACSVFVLPSYREGTPRTVLEAMAMGRPIITTDAPGCRETVRSGDNGFLVPVQSVDALADAMQRFIDEPELIERMGARSREIVEDKYDVNKVNAVMLREMGLS
jgi:glycosyltransferase involved in cell wall biosynthesis